MKPATETRHHYHKNRSDGMDYILARRLGIGYASIDKKISELLGIGEENGHELEIEFSDMSELKKYLKSR